MLCLPNMEREGPKFAYSKIQKAISRAKKVKVPTLSDISIVKHDAPVLKSLKSLVHTGPGISGIRLSNNAINGQLIPDVYVYRIN